MENLVSVLSYIKYISPAWLTFNDFDQLFCILCPDFIAVYGRKVKSKTSYIVILSTGNQWKFQNPWIYILQHFSQDIVKVWEQHLKSLVNFFPFCFPQIGLFIPSSVLSTLQRLLLTSTTAEKQCILLPPILKKTYERRKQQTIQIISFYVSTLTLKASSLFSNTCLFSYSDRFWFPQLVYKLPKGTDYDFYFFTSFIGSKTFHYT